MAKQRKGGPTADDWNATHPVGTRVRYQPVKGIDVFEETTTRSEAWEVCGTPVVKIVGRAGGCALDHLTVLDGADHEARS